MGEIELTTAKLDEIRQLASDETGCVRLTWHECIMLIAAARRSLVDDEPITAEWLRGQGWQHVPALDTYLKNADVCRLEVWQEPNETGWDVHVTGRAGPAKVAHMTTRGQLTKLIEALGGTT